MANRLLPVKRDERGEVVALVCTKCLEEKPASEFHKSASIKHGHRMPCKACQREQRAELQRAYNKRHPEKVKAALKRWHEKNPEYERERSKRRYETDLRYRQRLKVNSRRRARENPEYYAVAAHKRRELLRGAEGSFTLDDWRLVLRAHGGSCVYCGLSENITIDHLDPVSRGGDNDASNLAPACKSCNSKKKDDHADDYAASAGVLREFNERRVRGLAAMLGEMI